MAPRTVHQGDEPTALDLTLVDAPSTVPPADRRAFPAGLLAATRPRQWLKNLLVAAAPGAAGLLGRGPVLARTALAFAVFCLVSASMYLLNDVSDRPWDRLHPTKRRRPVASGAVPAPLAVTVATILAVAGLAGSIVLGWRFVVAVALYVAVTLAYSAWLKRIAVVDIAAVASGFVIRAVAGAAATHVVLSQWFLILVSFLSLFVVSGKRHGELLSTGLAADATDAARAPRRIEYSVAYLRSVWTVAGGVAMTAYCLWAFDQPHAHHHVPWSEVSAIPFVLAVLRYAMLLDQGRGGAPEDVLFEDRGLQVLVAAWIVVYGLGVYLGR